MSLFQNDSEQREAKGSQEIGECFDHYRLERELGRGFSSIVYAAHDDRRDRTVALKVLTFLQTLNEERRHDLEERFRREAQAVSILSHPNIVAIYDVGQGKDGKQFIAMEYLPGETLRSRLNHAAPLSVPETVGIGVRVAEALHFAHGRGIIHRDVKPDNIFLAHSGGEAVTPKLMDFGIAHVLSDQALTRDGAIVGSPAYMSPEQIHGLPLDARTDVFSLAITLTEMATGIKPFEAETIPAVMQKILRQDPDLRAVPDRNLKRILTKALAKNPSARYRDAQEFAQALRQTTPYSVPAPSIATQRFPQASLSEIRARPPCLSRLGAIGRRQLGLASLTVASLGFLSFAALPFLTGHSSASPQASPTYPAAVPHSMASIHPPIMAPANHPHHGRLDAVVPKQREKAPIRRVASRHTSDPAGHDSGVTITEETITEEVPGRGALAGRSSLASASHASQPPAIHVLRLAPTAQARRMLGTRAPDPIIRVAASSQKRSAGRGLNPASPAATSFYDAPPRPLARPMPQSVEGLDGTDATARLRLSVDETGDVAEAYILQSSGSRALDDAALDAVGHWQYAPASRGGKAVPGIAVETVQFGAAESSLEQSASRRPRPLSRPMPRPADGMDRTDATVRLRLSVDENGDVADAYILRSSGSRALDDAALDAVGHWEYDPPSRGGKPVPGVAIETVRFVPW